MSPRARRILLATLMMVTVTWLPIPADAQPVAPQQPAAPTASR